MIRYVSLIRFTEQGARAIQKSASRAAAFREAAAKAGVKVEAQYWTVGAFDGLLILSADNERQALQQLARLAEAGNVRTETLRALTADEFAATVSK
ncbi:MAG: GYD domain-containing protein [Verrucomicrobia bacterium]|nr:GYD domain-containing protein [Verrucomicrobiota bacterium]